MDVVRLSYKKILIKREIPIYTDRDILLGTIMISTIFKYIDNYTNTYENFGHSKLIIKVSKKYRIKKVNIHIEKENLKTHNILFINCPLKIIVYNSERAVRSQLITDILN